ncbi:hypothetical protein N7519_003197 [Penicillium mononematosum]|uniref:uncharacterized protein n=1 Tax=Penicillium mononematosum TaxID=268346 RepID=UPI002547596F|nr:uncharacterized protein N7519_003197 [Penicillium mononematosum]KAJ6188289.1 hypothetical protein N7519_003197 [Penicillium mononematosum]
MAASEEVLRAFNDILDIKVAYTWGRSQILTFMGHVVANGFLYDIQDSELLSLKAMVDEIHMLCPPDGATFSDPVMEPAQSTKRALNPIWQRNAPSQRSKFLLQTLVHNKVPFSGIYDILGLFLSSIGAAPNRATSRNFYLPMTAMYAKWCIALSEFVPKKSVPTMYNSTWVKDGPGKGPLVTRPLGTNCGLDIVLRFTLYYTYCEITQTPQLYMASH